MKRLVVAGTAVLAMTLGACSTPRSVVPGSDGRPAAAPARAPQTTPPPPTRPTPPAPQAQVDPANDWRRLSPAPFGTRLEDMPFKLTETLFFKDAHGPGSAGAQSGAEAGAAQGVQSGAEAGATQAGATQAGATQAGATQAGVPRAGDCFTPRGALPPVDGRAAQSFVLCFAHQRLSLIQAAVEIPRLSAAATLQRYCDLWLADSGADARSDASCSGHEGTLGFTARLDLDPAAEDGRFSVAVYSLDAGSWRP